MQSHRERRAFSLHSGPGMTCVLRFHLANMIAPTTGKASPYQALDVVTLSKLQIVLVSLPLQV